MPVGLQTLEVARVNRIINALQDVRELPQDLKFLARTPLINTVDSEVMARFVGRVQMADLIADDQRATVYQSGKLSYETTNIPNIKVGAIINQTMMNQLNAIQSYGMRDLGIFSDYLNRTIDALLLGVRQRMEALIVAMLTDSLSYDRLGIKISGATWGMPSDLKVTVTGGSTWDNASTATPVSDIQTLMEVASVRYGTVFNRVTMSHQAFRYMTATTEFQNRAKLYLSVAQTPSMLPYADVKFMQPLAAQVLGVGEVEIYDARAWTQDGAGVQTSAPYLPVPTVLLTSTVNDNNPAAFDFANAITTESQVSALTGGGGLIGRFDAGEYGPIAYATAPTDMNPPNVTLWGAARGFPRKHLLQSSAVITTGTYTSSISVGVPF